MPANLPYHTFRFPLQSAAVFVKLRGAADYVEVRILTPAVGNGFGLKRAAVSAIFEGGENAPLLRDVTLHLVQSANTELPTYKEERLAQQTLFPTSRSVGRDMHNKHFLLVVVDAGNLVSEFSGDIYERCKHERCKLYRYLHADSLPQSRGDCCSISFWCRSKQALERLIIIALAVAMALSGALAKHYWG